MKPTTSVLIRTKNEVKDIPKALDLIRSQTWQPIEIVVVDSGSTDGTIELLKQQSDVKLIQILPEEFTFGRSLNIGLKAVVGEVVASLSAHAFPCDRHWLENLVKHFDDPQVAGVYGKQIPQPDAWPPVQRDYLSYYKDQRRFQTRIEKRSDHAFSNANSAIRRAYWQRRLFDENLTGVEDQEWAKAMLELGYKIVYEPEASLYHSHNESLKKVYQRTYREALAHRDIYGDQARTMNLGIAFQLWWKSVFADVKFILKQRHGYDWVFRSPIYRLFWVYGYFKPSMPNHLWQLFLGRSQQLIHPNVPQE